MSITNKEDLCISVRASAAQLKVLFRKKEDIESIFKDNGKYHECSSVALYKSLEFLAPFIRHNSPLFQDYRSSDISLLPANVTDIKLYFQLSADEIKEVKIWMGLIAKSLLEYINGKLDVNYELLDFLYTSVGRRRKDFRTFIQSGFKMDGPVSIETFDFKVKP